MRVANYTSESWRLLLEDMLPDDQPIEFHLAWIKRESAGNPCAVGNLAAHDAAGRILETGLYQLYSPDEIELAHTTYEVMRAGCAPNSQLCSRALTDAERRAHVQAGITYIARRMNDARAELSKFGASWNRPDFFRLVKLYHALTSLPHVALQAVTDKIGQAPTSWQELRYNLFDLDVAKYNPATARYAPFASVLDNSEDVGGSVPDDGSSWP